MKKLLTLGVLAAMTVLGQTDTRARQASLDNAKAALSLTDTQIDQIKAARSAFRESTATLRTQLREKMEALHTAQRAENPNAAEIAQLIVDIKALRTQIAEKQPELQKATRAVLTPEQLIQVTALEQAQKLQPAIRESIGLGLLAVPEGSDFGPGMGRGRPGAGPQGRPGGARTAQ